jgi:hypothetical protein
MALFTREEICQNCEYATWHLCDECVGGPHFCHCEIDETPDFMSGKCDNKKIHKNF